VQVDPIQPTLKPPGTKRLKLNYDETLSIFAFKFNLRRYTLRLHPPATKPRRVAVRDLVLPDGTAVRAGATAVLDMHAAAPAALARRGGVVARAMARGWE